MFYGVIYVEHTLEEHTFFPRERLYANMDELYAQVPQEEVDPYGYGDETIYDSIVYYRRPPEVSSSGVCSCYYYIDLGGQYRIRYR